MKSYYLQPIGWIMIQRRKGLHSKCITIGWRDYHQSLSLEVKETSYFWLLIESVRNTPTMIRKVLAFWDLVVQSASILIPLLVDWIKEVKKPWRYRISLNEWLVYLYQITLMTIATKMTLFFIYWLNVNHHLFAEAMSLNV